MGKKKNKGKKAKKVQQVVVVHPPAGPGLGAAILTQAIAAGVAYGVARHLAARPEQPAPPHGLARFVTRHPRAAWDLALWQGGERLKAWGDNLHRRLHHNHKEDELPPARGIPDQRRPPHGKTNT